jgi:phage terminase large subunit GpA-like protein
MDCLSVTSSIEEVVIMSGAQLGKTETGNNWIGYIIDRVPGPMMSVQPTVDLAKRYSKQRIDPLIEESPRLRDKVKPQRERDSGNTMLAKEFPGGILVLTGANSAVGLRSVPARYLFMDEIDGYPHDVDGEGDPVSLARARTRTYARRKILLTSTPTIAGKSRIEMAFDESDQRRYYLKCPHCQHEQIIRWTQIKWEPGQPKTAHMVCEGNGCRIEEHHKTQMLAEGRWVAENPGARGGKVAGFHINSLYSPVGWFSWADAAQLWDESHKNHEKLRSFVNTVLGETWKERGDAPDWRRIYERREPYARNSIPDEAEFLTAGVDVQKDRLEMQIVAWGRNKECWSLDHRIAMGDSSDLSESGPWSELSKWINEAFTTPGGEVMPLRLIGIDSGFNTQVVYDYVRRWPPNKVVALKGFDHLQVIVGTPTAVDVTSGGRKIRRGLKVWPMGSSVIKTEIYGYLRADMPTETELAESGFSPGFIHFPEYDEEFFKQLTAEQLMTRVIKGYRKYEWSKVYERNEALDTMVMARACASIVGIDRMVWNIEPRSEQKSAQVSSEFNEKQQKSADFSSNQSIIRKKSSFWDR